MIRKAVILAGGMGTRLAPLTNVINKHLLPVGDRPMIMHPIKNLVDSGIRDILIVVGGGLKSGQFMELLGDGSSMGAKLYYAYQSQPTGIAGALMQAKTFTGDEQFLVILGDNIFSRPLIQAMCNGTAVKYFSTSHKPLEGQEHGAAIFVTDVTNLSDYGVLHQKDGRMHIIEKPANPPRGGRAVTGVYIYPSDVYSVINTLKPSGRGELEITDVNNHYLDTDRLEVVPLGCGWHDCGASIEQYQEVSRLLLTPQWNAGLQRLHPEGEDIYSSLDDIQVAAESPAVID